MPIVFARRPVHIGTLLLSVAFLGCMDESQIRTYTIPAGEEPMTTDRLKPMFAGKDRPAVTLPDFDRPAEWRAAASDQFSAAAFAAGPDDRPVRITITQTPAAMGLLAQLNRWRRQVGMDPMTEEDIDKQVGTLQIGEVEASFVQFSGPTGDSITGAVAEVGEQMWFFKMRGPAQTVIEETDRMRAFCKSVRFKSE